MRFFIVFDNTNADPLFQALWGFSCYIRLENRDILFDTGSDGRVLLRNAKLLGLDFRQISTLFLSHPHWDHIGGVDSIIEIHPDIEVIVPNSFSPRLVENFERQVKSVRVIGYHPEKIAPALFSTGTLGRVGEHSLIIDKEPATVVVGCSHPGIEHIVPIASKTIGRPIEYVIGGLHLFEASRQKILHTAQTLKEQGVKFITPTHCSGQEAQEIFSEIFKEGYLPGGAGRVIEF